MVAMRGQGKTTLLRLAAGMVAPDEGRVLLGREDLAGLSDRAHSRLLREQIGWAGRARPGDRRARCSTTSRCVWRSAGAAAGARCARTPSRRSSVWAPSSCAERRWEELSDWERALVEIAQAIAGTPRLLLIDDVIDGLGMRETDELARLVRALARGSADRRADGRLRPRGGALLAPRPLARGGPPRALLLRPTASTASRT